MQLETAFSNAAIPTTPINYRSAYQAASPPLDLTDLSDGPWYDITVSTLNHVDHVLATAYFPRLYSSLRYRIATWWWETDVFTRWQKLGAKTVDELWVGAQYQVDIFSRLVDVPIHVFPYPIPPLIEQSIDVRSQLGLDDRFWFAFQFDWPSSATRKNVFGLVDAYCRAFPKASFDTGLLIKSRSPQSDPAAAARLDAIIADRPDIRHICDDWPRELNEQFSYAYDAYISLHRTEGLGLTMAAAMSAGKPVIATGYSGNLAYMDDSCAYLVPYCLDVISGDPTYPDGGHWATPDLEAAAETMRTVREMTTESRKIGEAGRKRVAEFTPSRAANWVQHRLSQLDRTLERK